MKCIMRYLKGTQNLGLVYRQQQNEATQNNMLRLVGFTDSDWAGDAEQRRSTAAYAVMAISAPLSWSSKRLHTICLSSTEAEYAARTEAAKELVSHRKFAEGLGQKYEHPTELLCDSQSAIALSQNPIYHARTKHIKIKHHYIRQLISEGEVILRYVATEENLADILTKPLPGLLHQKHVKGLGLTDVTLEKARPKSHTAHMEIFQAGADHKDTLGGRKPALAASSLLGGSIESTQTQSAGRIEQISRRIHEHHMSIEQAQLLLSKSVRTAARGSSRTMAVNECEV